MPTIIDGSLGVTFPAGGLGNPASAVVGLTDTQTLTNKSIVASQLTGTQNIPKATLPTGSVLQVVQGTYTTTVSTTSTTFVTTNITASITPSSTTSKIFAFSNIPCYISASTGELHLAIYRNNTTNIFGTDACDLFSSSGGVISNQGLCYLDSPSTTSLTSYTVYIRRDTTGTAYSCVNGNMATITLMEISA